MIGLPESRAATRRGIWLRGDGSASRKRGGGPGWGGGVTRSLGEELERQPLSQFCQQSCPVSGYCRTAVSTPRYYGDQSFACPAGAAASSSGNGKWKRRTRAGKAGAERHPSPRAPRGGAGRRARARTQGSLNAAARVQRPGPRVRTSGPPWPVLTWAARKRRIQYLSPSSGLPGVQQGFKCVSKQLAVCA